MIALDILFVKNLSESIKLRSLHLTQELKHLVFDSRSISENSPMYFSNFSASRLLSIAFVNCSMTNSFVPML